MLDYEGELASLPAHHEASLELVRAVLEEGARLAQDALAPLNRSGDEEGCHWEDGKVRTPEGFGRAYSLYREGGWPGLVADPAFGGQGLPRVVGLILREIVSGANTAFGTYLGLSQSAYSAISAHGDDTLRKRFLPHLVDGSWMGTMCLTEPHCGSDLGLIRTRAEPAPDGAYRVTGTKIFVTAGEHDLSDNIVHLVLARLPDAPAGTKGLSLFAVPKLLPGEDGEWTLPNMLECTGIEHKMGIKASATASLAFNGARGWLVGRENQGLRAMFTMMNSSRLGVSVQSVGLAEAALQAASAYARERRQGRDAGSAEALVPIVAHADVRRNLFTARAFVEGARALWLWAGIRLDQQYAHPDAEHRARCEGYLALLTPVFKSYFSDRSFEATNAAMQVFGGHGYIRETGVEQYVRDGRIIPLYEGTNGIQALDLVSRKITGDGGAMVQAFFALVQGESERMECLRPRFSRALNEALGSLRAATDYVIESARTDPHANGAAGHDYLQLFGLVAMGFAWAKMTCAAHGLRDSGLAGMAQSKLDVADFFFSRILPEAGYRHRIVCAGSASIMAPDSFVT